MLDFTFCGNYNDCKFNMPNVACTPTLNNRSNSICRKPLRKEGIKKQFVFADE